MKALVEFYRNLYHQNKAWFDIALKCFLFAICIGVIAFFANPNLMQTIVSGFQDKFGTNPALDFHLALQIFLQNLTVSILALFGGLLLGLGSFLVIAVNGFLIGYVITSILFIPEGNLITSLALILGGLVPHGIFELPAFLVAGTLGLRLGLEWMQKKSVGQRKTIFKRNFIQVFLILPSIALVLFIAALIEVFISSKLIGG